MINYMVVNWLKGKGNRKKKDSKEKKKSSSGDL